MAITSSDLFFVESERATDDNTNALPTTGNGGDMGFAIAQDAVENNIFPDVMPGDRVTGKVQMRKVYAAVLSADNDALANAQFGMLARPTDANVEVCVFASESSGGTDISFVAGNTPYDEARSALGSVLGSTATTGFSGNTFSGCSPDPTIEFSAGDLVSCTNAGTFFRKVTAVTSSTLTVDGAALGSSGVSVELLHHKVRDDTNSYSAVSGLSLTTALAAVGATQMTLDRLEVRVSLGASTAYATNTNYQFVKGGKQPLYVEGDQILLQHPSVPATRELVIVDRVDYATNIVTFTTATVNEYPVGSKVTRPVPLRTLQANVSVAPFAQQAWTRTWSNTIIGSAITARYSGAVGLKNAGTTNDRWAIIFTSSTQFDIFSERLGKVGSGNVGANATPLNPLTSQPYFTLYPAGWGSGWVVGNVVRFNTRAAAAPCWVSRCVSPGAATGDDSMSLFMRGDIDA